MDTKTEAGCKSVRVQNLPFDLTNDELEQIFSEVGPIRRAFVVNDPSTKRSKGYGYVAFALTEDATAATKKIDGHVIKGRTLSVRLASRSKNIRNASEISSTVNVVNRKGKKSNADDVKRSVRTVVVWIESTAPLDDMTQGPFVDRLKHCGTIDDICVYRGNLIPQKYKVEMSSEVPIEQRFVAVVLMSSAQEAKLVVQKNDRQRTSALRMVARRLCSFARTRKAKQTCELIIRNLPFSATRDQVRASFSKFGPIAQIRLPNTGERNGGFAFVRFHFRSDAAKAMRKLNAKPFGADPSQGKKKKKKKEKRAVEDGRVIAVDWALSKASFTSISKDTPQEDTDSSDSESDEESASPLTNAIDKDAEQDGVERERGERIPDPDADVQKGTTLFVCNIPLTSTYGDLLRLFGRFGHIRSLKLVKDRASGSFRGSAFVLYQNKSSADAALSKSDAVVAGGKVDMTSANDSVLLLQDRPLVVRRAVDRAEAISLTERQRKSSKKNDRRNIHLLEEGHLTRESEAANGLKESELKKRQRGDKDNREKLRSPLFFVSPTRLAIRNLSTSGASSLNTKLRNAVLGAAKDGLRRGAVDINNVPPHFRPAPKSSADPLSPDIVNIKSLSILRDKDRRDSKGRPRSRGFAFVEFGEHVHALAALRELNNNPKFSFLSSTGNERLIVNFSVENKAMLRRQREMQERRRALNEKDAERKKLREEREALRATSSATTVDMSDGKSRVVETSTSGAIGLLDTMNDKEMKKKKMTRREKKKIDREVKTRKQRRNAFSTGVKSSVSHVSSVAKNAIAIVAESSLRSVSAQSRRQSSDVVEKKKRRKVKRRRERQSDDDRRVDRAAADNPVDVEQEKKRKVKNQIKRRRKRGDDHSFDGLVSDYKNKLFGGDGMKKDRWFV